VTDRPYVKKDISRACERNASEKGTRLPKAVGLVVYKCDCQELLLLGTDGMRKKG
jgi:hypothetical protein